MEGCRERPDGQELGRLGGVNGPLETEGGALAGANADGELTVAGGGELMDDAMTEAMAGAGRRAARDEDRPRRWWGACRGRCLRR